MAHLSCIELTPAEQSQLLNIARSSVAEGLRTERPLAVDAAEFEGALTEIYGNFVTLTQDGDLRGCMGTLQGALSLAEDVAITAFNSAFNDARFPRLTAGEFAETRIDISVLSQPQPLAADSPSALLEQLRPREHGLIVEDRGHRATLLPKVWEKVPDARQFIMQLLVKAGLPPDHWSETLRFYRYTVFEIA